MNKTRCPWCGKLINRKNDRISFNEWIDKKVPIAYRMGKCAHCRHKYAKVPTLQYILLQILIVVLLIASVMIITNFKYKYLYYALAVIFFVLSSFFVHFSKVDDEKSKVCKVDTQLLCSIIIVEKYNKIERNQLYFLSSCFDEYEPFTLASPIQIHDISKSENLVLGEFIYMNEKNQEYITKQVCELFDTKMNLVAKIKFKNTGESALQLSSIN